MYLIDKQDYLALTLYHGIDNAFQPFLELALIFSTGHEGAHVQRIDLLGLQVFRHVLTDYPLGYAFRDSRLSDTRLTDQYRIVLRPSAQNLEHPPDFLIPADDGIELPFSGTLVQIDRVPFQEFLVVIVLRVIHIIHNFSPLFI